MLNREHRLPSSISFRNVKIITTPCFSLRLKQNNLPVSRFGFLISKRVEKTAVGRNNIKRRFRACIEKKLPGIKEGFDLLFLLKTEVLDQPSSTICAMIDDVLKKEHVLKNK